MSTATQPPAQANPGTDDNEPRDAHGPDGADDAMPLAPVLIAGGVMLAVCIAALLALRTLDQRRVAAKQARTEAAAAAEAERTARPRMRNLGDFPAFALTSHREQAIDNAALDGKVWVLQYFFACCDKSCPMMVQQMAELQTKHADAGLRFVSITVDPERDDPKALAKHAARFAEMAGVDDPSRWHLLTGKRHKILQLLDKCNLPIPPAAFTTDEPIGHVDKFFLVDASGVIRGIYQYDDEQQMTELDEDILAALGERKSSQ